MTEELHEAAAAYALDALDERERQEFEAHLATCRRCAAEVEDFRRTAAALGEAELAPPPPELKAQVLAAASGTPQVTPSGESTAGPGDRRIPDAEAVGMADFVARTGRRRGPGRGPRLLLAAAAAVVVIAGVGAGLWATTRSTGQAAELAEVLEAPDAVTTPLDGEGATLRVVWSPEHDRAAVLGQGLDDPGEGQAYALWQVLDDQRVVPAGLFTPDGGEVEALVDVEDLDGIGWGVTVEPDTGSAQPTTDVIFSGARPGA